VNRDDTGPGSEFAAPSKAADFRRDLRLADHVAVWNLSATAASRLPAA